MKKILYLLTILSLAACTTDDDEILLSDSQQSLLGQAVRFDASYAQPFVTRTTYIHNGSVNEGDQMRIFRQYALNTDNSSFDENTEAYRTYYLKMNYAAGTSVSLNSDWLPMVGKLKSDDSNAAPQIQTSADSLTWENGRTVRFRAWGRSNLAGRLSAGTKTSYDPDYTVTDWVTVSGPTKSIPLTMRHITCRIGLTCKAGNEFGSATICTDWQDYKHSDNADTQANDDAESTKTDEEAQAELAQVMSVYNKMCMPAGVDDQTFLLTAMTSQLYDGTETDFKNLEKYGTADGIVKIATKSASDIAANVQHPVFNANDGRLYMMSIPFEPETRSFGQPKLEVNAAAENKSISVPRVSPDGRYVLYTKGDYGQFHIWHKSSDLWVKDLQTDSCYALTEANSPDVDSFHSWSSNGRWFVFSSRRMDGNYTRPFIAYFDEQGRAHKAFVIPQEDPEWNILLLKSYNVPELSRDAVRISMQDLHHCIYETEGENATYKPNPTAIVNLDATTGASQKVDGTSGASPKKPSLCCVESFSSFSVP